MSDAERLLHEVLEAVLNGPVQVSVSCDLESNCVRIVATLNPADLAKLIGNGADLACAIRRLFKAISKTQRKAYRIVFRDFEESIVALAVVKASCYDPEH